MRERVLGGGGEGPGSASLPDLTTAWRMALFAGIVFVAVGLIDVGLIWYPPRWQSVDWEFGSISGTFDALPLSTIGLSLVLFSAVARGRIRAMRVMSVLLLLVALVLVVFAVVLLLDVPVVLRAVQPQMRPVMKRALGKTFGIAMCYITLYGVFGVWAMRRAKASATRS